MTYSTSFSSKLRLFLLLLWICVGSGCSAVHYSKPEIVSLRADKPSPQLANSGDIVWQAEISGGTAPYSYDFTLVANKRETIVQTGAENAWAWAPRHSGNFLIRVRVKDAKGFNTTSDWIAFRIDPSINSASLIAFFPLENISGVRAPLKEISLKYSNLLQDSGFKLLSQKRLEDFMYRHRVRYTGGIGSELAHALRVEENVEAVFITSLESYDENNTPKIALTSRLVLCRDEPEIVWIDGVGLTGDDSPGLLGLKRIDRFATLQGKALGMLLDSLQNHLAADHGQDPENLDKIEPDDYYLASDFVAAKHYKIAVVPFLNRYARRNAGFVIPLNFVKLLHRHDNLQVVEPGLVREKLLKYRLIMQAGPSLAVADALASDSTLSADLIFSGYVFDYQDQFGTPKIDFATRLFSGPQREVIWWSRSIATGDDGVYFFDVGRYRSTHVMLQDMLHAIDELLFPQKSFQPKTQNTAVPDQLHH